MCAVGLRWRWRDQGHNIKVKKGTYWDGEGTRMPYVEVSSLMTVSQVASKAEMSTRTYQHHSRL